MRDIVAVWGLAGAVGVMCGLVVARAARVSTARRRVRTLASGSGNGPGSAVGPGATRVEWLQGRVLVAAGRLRDRLSADRARTRRNRAAAEVLSALAADLRAGATFEEGLVRACEGVPDAPGWARAAASAGLGADAVVQALERDAGDLGVRWWDSLATCWALAHAHGTPAAPVVERLAASARAQLTLRGELAAALAGPRATAGLLVSLPALGLLMGTGMGADPLGWLLGSSAGRLVAVAGLSLEGIGWWWTRAMALGVERAL